MGTPQEDDSYILHLPENPHWSLGAGLTDDGRCWPHCPHFAPSCEPEQPALQRACVQPLTLPEAAAALLIADAAALTTALMHYGCRFVIISIGDGCSPTNRLWYLDLEGIPRSKQVDFC